MPPFKVICFLFDPNTGGPTIRARAVYERMTGQGHEVRLALPDRPGSAAGYLAEAGLETDSLSIAKPVPPSRPGAFLRFCLSLPASTWRLRRYLRQQRPDVVHVNGAFDVVPAFGARLAGVPVVWHLNDTVFGARMSRLLGRMVRIVASQVVAAADRVARHYGIPEGRYHTIYAPVDVARFSPRPPDGHPRAEGRLILVGNWNWIKAQDRFVEVIRHLRARDLDVRGLVAGRFLDSQTGFWRPILDDIRAHGLEDVIDTPGFVADTYAALCESDLLLLTSHSEASPIAVLEAMAVGVPQVVFDVGGVREMIGEGDDAAGIIVKEGDVAAMAEAVEDLLRDPERYARMARSGQRRAREHFSLEACVERHLAAYASAIGSRKGTA